MGMGNTFAGTQEAFLGEVNAWQPVNNRDEGSAQQMRIALHDVPDLAATFAEGLDTLAEKIVDRVLLDSGAADLIRQLAQNMRTQVDQFREIAHQVDSIHDDRLAHMRSQDPRAASWDWKGNQDDDLA